MRGQQEIWLHDLTVAVNIGYRAHELGGILRKLRAHRKKLLAAWNDHLGN
jgi:hypothetical protein